MAPRPDSSPQGGYCVATCAKTRALYDTIILFESIVLSYADLSFIILDGYGISPLLELFRILLVWY